MRYVELYSKEDLAKLRDGLEIIERVVDREDRPSDKIWLYGLCTDSLILNSAKEAIIDSAEDYMNDDGATTLSENDVELTEIAIAIPVGTSDAIDILYGNGYPLRELSFAYQAGEGEGVRTSSFTEAWKSDRIGIGDLLELSLADTDLDLDDYLKEKGTGSRVQFKKPQVVRNEEATTTPTPAAPAAPPAPVAPVQPGVPKQTSLKISTISEILEGFLG